LAGFLGAASNDENQGRNAVFGAAAGAIAGGAIGAALDRQARDLRASMANDQILIRNTGEELIVTMPDGILFDFDSAAIRASLQSDLRALARNLQQYPDTTVDVIGHTDSDGSPEYNMDLSSRRAAAVAGVLLEEGVAPFRVRSFGRGEEQPVATNLTPEGRAQNRRVEVDHPPHPLTHGPETRRATGLAAKRSYSLTNPGGRWRCRFNASRPRNCRIPWCGRSNS
jgi:outer membrane protein OmpA-like peptidoglycan-associated protein